jgi:argininosuccinate synthase
VTTEKGRPPAARVVLAYAPGTPAGNGQAVPWLRRTQDAEVIAVTVDLGAGRELEAVRDAALAAGAARAHVMDAREEFTRQFFLPALQAGAVGDLDALARPLVARKLVEVAAIEHARLVSGASSLQRLVSDLDPTLSFIAVPAELDRRIDARPLRPVAASDASAIVSLTFERGVPTALNGIVMPLPEVIGSLGTIAAAHGIRAVEPLLQAAHQALQSRMIDADLRRTVSAQTREYVALIDEGRWFTPARPALDASVADVQRLVTGSVALNLYGGGWSIRDHQAG